MFRTLVVLLLLLGPSVAQAHPGMHHGSLFSVLAHLLIEPDHLAMLLASVAVGIWGIRRMRARKSAKK